MKTGSFIYNINHDLVEVTDFDEAMRFVKDAVQWHETRKALKEAGEDVLYFPEGHKDYLYQLRQLEQIERARNS